jgi:hypothetical protein
VWIVAAVLLWNSLCSGTVRAEDATAPVPKIYLNGQSADVTVQDLSGFATRPLRILIERNNRIRENASFIRVFALGVREGDELMAEVAVSFPGIRMTVYKLFCSINGPRYLSMPASIYFFEAKTETYKERIESSDEEFLIMVFENTQSPDNKNIQIRYFEEKVRKLVLSSYRTNLTLSSLKFKLKDFGEEQDSKFFERDAQLLVDRFIHPQQVFILRLWRKK